MEKEQPKKNTKNLFIGAIIGVILYKIVVDLIWTMISG